MGKRYKDREDCERFLHNLNRRYGFKLWNEKKVSIESAGAGLEFIDDNEFDDNGFSLNDDSSNDMMQNGDREMEQKFNNDFNDNSDFGWNGFDPEDINETNDFSNEPFEPGDREMEQKFNNDDNGDFGMNMDGGDFEDGEPFPNDFKGASGDFDHFGNDDPAIENTLKDVGADGFDTEVSIMEDENGEFSINDIASGDTSIMEVVSLSVNKYVNNFAEIYKKNQNIIDFTGAFNDSTLNKDFVSPIMELLNNTFQGDKLVEKIQSLISLLGNRSLVNAIVGTPTEPFVYEGLQLLLVTALHNMLGLIPYTVQRNEAPESVIAALKLTTTNDIFDAIDDVMESSGKLGREIFYVPSEKSDITGKDERVLNTPYANNPSVVKGRETLTPMSLANESIMNLIKIKNNKSLEEYFSILKAITFASHLLKDVEIGRVLNESYTTVREALFATPDNSEEKLNDAVDKFRENLFMQQNKIIADLRAEEDNEALKDE